MAELKLPFWAVLVIAMALILLLLFVVSGNQIWDFIRAQGKAILTALNQLVSGRPIWMHD